MSANCEYFQGLMSQMLDGDLIPAEVSVLREHIRTCSDCRGLCGALSAITLSLRGDLVDPPDALADGVMRRIEAYEAENAAPPEPIPEPEPEIVPFKAEAEPPAPEPTPAAPEKKPSPRPVQKPAPYHARPSKKPVRAWPRLAAAACLILMIGGGAFAALRGFGGGAPMSAAAQSESSMITMDAMPAPEAAGPGPVMFAAEADEAEEAAADEAPAEAPAAMDGAAQSMSSPVYTRDAPASVPEGREADFEALLLDARWGDAGAPAADWSVIAAVEYRGVVYEFLTDENEEYLLWQDAAEGMPVHSPASVEALWAILQ